VETMRLTARQLRRIIQEEAQKCLVEEYTYAEAPTSQVLLDDLSRWREEILGMMNAIEQGNVQPPATSDPGPGPSPDIHKELVAKLNRAAAELFSVTTMLNEDAKGEPLAEEYRGSRDDTRGGYGNWEGFPASQAVALAKKIAGAAPGPRPVRYGIMSSLINHVRNAKYGTASEAKKDIIQWLVDNDGRQAYDFRNV